MATLYELTAQAAYLYDLLQAEEIDEQTFEDTLACMGAEEKVESYCKVIRQLKADAEMFRQEADRLSARKKTAENGMERMRRALLSFLCSTGRESVKAGPFQVSVIRSQSAEIVDEAALPPQYLIPQPCKIDKAGIRQALKDGVPVNGAVLVTTEGVKIR